MREADHNLAFRFGAMLCGRVRHAFTYLKVKEVRFDHVPNPCAMLGIAQQYEAGELKVAPRIAAV